MSVSSHAAVWYVNDNVTAGDSYTYAVGADTQPGTAAEPFRAIGRAIKDSAMPGDTIFIDVGMYGETVVMDSPDAQITLIGVDSRVTIIDPPGPNTAGGLIAILVKNCTGVTIKNIGITGSFDGIVLDNVDSAVIDNDSISRCGNFGVFVKSGNFNRITNNIIFDLNNGGYSIKLDSGQNTISSNTIDSGAYGMLVSSESNVISLNTVKNNLNIGIYLNVSGAYGNRIETNTLTGNGTWGLYLAGPENRAYGNIIRQNTSGGVYTSAASNVIRFNLIQSNTAVGMEITNNTNIVEQNDITGNDTGVFFNASTAGIIIRKNNIHSNNVNNIRNGYSAVQTFDRNWWGTTDSIAIQAKLTGAGLDSYTPYRLGAVDTAAGADTTAPKSPDTVGVIGSPSDTSIILEWSAVTALEESNGGAVGLSGYRIYRCTLKDTSSWIKVGQATSGIRYQDTDVAVGRVYYYRVTAFDAAARANESFYSDSQPSDSAWANRVNFYVNDGSTASDSFTYAAGSDLSVGEGTRQRPFASLAKAMQYVTDGDTIWLDAGTFGSDTWEMVSATETAAVNLDTDNLTLIGKDSGSSIIDPPGPKTLTNLSGIYATGRTGLVIKNLGITGANNGIEFTNVDLSTISGDSIGSCGTSSILFTTGSDSNTVKDNTTSNNAIRGIDIQGGTNNTIDNNIANSNVGIGIRFSTNATKNVVKNNTANSNTTYGIYLSSVTQTAGFDIFNNTLNANATGIGFSSAFSSTIRNNVITSSTNQGILIQSSDTNAVYQNDITGGDSGVVIEGSSTNNTVSKNNITGSLVSSVYNSAGIAQTITRNWYGSADSVAIKNKISDTVSAFSPYRVGAVDTTAGADTTAPKAPDTVAIIGAPSDTSIIVEWSAVTALEETNGGAVSLSGYRVYRAESKDSSSFLKIGQTGSGTIRFQDTDATVGKVYYYRVTAFDAATLANESFYSDSQPSDSAAFSSTKNWYVNDTSTAGDSYTSAVGSNATGKGTPSSALSTIAKAMQFATAGDTVWVDAGLYTEAVVINIDSLALIGKDSNATVVDPPGANATAGVWGIYADTQTGLLIKNLGVTGAYNGIRLDNVDLSTVSNDSVSTCGNFAVYLLSGSDTNTLSGNQVVSNSNYGINVYGSGNTITNNISNSNSSTGINIEPGSNGNTVSGNTANSNINYGIIIKANSNNNTLTNNTTNSNTSVGIQLTGSNNVVSGNTANSNTDFGIWLDVSTGNMIRNNVAKSNGSAGIRLSTGSDTNTIVQNEISGNDSGVHILDSSRNNLISKNNISGNDVNNVYNQGGQPQTLTRNWFGSADSVTIKNKISDTANAWTPWRLDVADTASAADTVAPKAPDTVGVIGAPSDTSIILEWSAVTVNEESVAGAAGLSGYRIYRSTVKDTSSWIKVGQVTSGIRYQDTDAAVGKVYYYRVTAFDAATFPNESFYSDSQPSDSAVFTTTKNWYVNDTSTAGDSYTSAAGSDVTGKGTASSPLKTIGKAMQFATAGDTVWVDAGLYTEAVVINIDSLALIGKDSNATVIDPPGSNATAGIWGIYADTQTSLLIKNMGVTGAYNGIRFENVDLSTISGDSVSTCGNFAVYLYGGCDTNTLSGNNVISNSNLGILISSSSNNTIESNTCNSNSSSGIMVQVASNGNTITGNTSNSNVNYGISLYISSNNKITNNGTTSNTSGGIVIDSGTGNIISGNVAVSNPDGGIWLVGGATGNMVRGNNVRSSGGIGIRLAESSVSNSITQNEVSNSDTGIWIADSSNGHAITKNNLAVNNTSNLHNRAGFTNTISRNWFGSADSAAIKNKISDTAGDWDPWRLGQVDTATGADTTAPKAPDTVGIVGSPSDTSVILEWSAVTALEETNGGAVGLSGYRVYRSTAKDTSSWIKLAQVASGIRYQDTEATLGVTYYYRVTAFDAATFPNESFYSDSQPFDSAVEGPRVNWYVNDGSTTGDSFTSATGSDMAAGKGTASAPFASIPRAMQFATAGDTIWIDAGLYDSYVNISSTETTGVNIDKDSITLIGKDSNATVIDPQGPATIGYFGIHADTQTGLLIKNLGVTGAYVGIRFDNVDLSTIKSDSFSCGDKVIYIQSGSSSNTVSENEVYSLGDGIFLLTGCNNNNVDNNNVYPSTGIGIYVNGSSNNTISRNTVKSAGEYGFFLATGSNTNTYFRNIARSSVAGGIKIQSSNTNLFYQNEITGSDTGVLFTGTASGNTVTKNNITACNVNFIDNPSGIAQTITRNWYGSADSVTIKAKINDSMDAFVPYRLGVVDTTASGADTVAPKAPDTVAVIGSPSDTSVILEWSDSTANEEAVAGGGISVYRVYRSAVKDTSSWIKVAQVSSTVHRWQDTDAAVGQVYYYRITSVDSATPFENESFFSDSQPSDSAVFSSTKNWYANDGSTTGDSFTSAAGSDAASGKGTAGAPFATIVRAMRFATAGDTIWIDAGLYDSYVTVNSTETAGVNIDKDSITLIGKDSAATVIDPPGAKTITTLYGIYADTQSGLTVKNIGVTGAYDGIKFVNVDRSTITVDSTTSNGGRGISIWDGSDTNTISNNTSIANTNNGIELNNVCNGNTISNNFLNSNSQNGVFINSGSGNTANANTASSNSSRGIYLAASSNNTVTNNTANSNTNYGIQLDSVSDANTVTGNTVNSNNYGIYLASASNNTIASNISNSNTTYGVYLNPGSSNSIRNNLMRSNGSASVRLVSSDTNAVVLNDMSGGVEGIFLTNSSRNNVISKNNITGQSNNNIDNRAYEPQTLARNWFGTTDSVTIASLYLDTTNVFAPYRLGLVDTTAGADTTAPKAPDTVAIIGAPSDTSIILEWSAVTALEESNGGAVGLSGYRVYRSAVKDTSSWLKVAQVGSGAIRYQDTDVLPGQVFYYRVTAFDAATFPNESFFSDSQPSDSAVAASRVNWYVNNNSVTGDSFTFATGSDTSGDGTAQKPYRTISKALGIATTGDTIFIDAGLYAETVVIEANSMALIGKDSNATVIDPPGSSGAAGLNGISAASLTGITIKNLGVTGANRGIFFQNVDLATLTGDSIAAAGSDGIRLDSGCDTNMIDRTTFHNNQGNYALHVSGNGNTVRQNLFTGNTSTNIIVTAPAQDNLVESNTISGGLYGVWINQGGATRTRILGNVITDMTQIGIPLDTTDSNVIRGNLIRNSAVRGINLYSSQGNVIEQNQVDANPAYTIYIDGASAGNVVQKNNFIITSPVTPDSGVYNNTSKTHDFSRNWWGTTDEVTIRNRIAGVGADSITFRPYRLRQVDTTLGADTTAPAKPTGVTLDTTSLAGNIVLTWVNPTINEETNGGTVGNVGVRVFRLRNLVDTTNWANQVNLVHTGTSTETTWTDSDVNLAVTYYYRLSARDAAALPNDAFFTDTKFASPSLAANATGRWYVNDLYTAADSFTSLGGSDTAGNGTAANPYRTITKALVQVKAGDTVYIDAGTFTETVVIDTDQISLIGKDSNATVIDPPGSSATGGLYGIYATARVDLLIKNLGVTGANVGINFNNVDRSTISGDSVCSSGSYGIYLQTNSDTNTLSGNTASSNVNYGIYLTASSSNNTLSGNTAGSNAYGIFLESSSNNNTVTNNTAISNTTAGIFLNSNSSNNTLSGNTANSNSTYGIYLNSNSNNNTLSGNTANSNAFGFYLATCSNNTLSGNAVSSNSSNGIYLLTSSDGNGVINNAVNSNANYGIYLSASSNNTVVQNDLNSNTQYQIYIEGASSSDTVQKNNIKPSGTNPDSGVFNGSTVTTNKFTFTRNWWGTTDETKIGNMIYQPSNGDSVIRSPYRLGAIDTAAGADTTAPIKPSGVTLDTTVAGAIKITWVIPTINEETNGGAVGFAGLSIGRLTNQVDTTNWANSVNLVKQTNSTDTTWTDTNVILGSTYYYRLTSKDAATFFNESFFTDTKFASPALAANTGGRWYVNTTYNSATDSFTTAAGADTAAGNGTVSAPYRSITKALQNSKAGDTIYIDAGTYAETVVIDTDQISLIGKDSNATVIDPPGANSTTDLYGIYADTQTGLLIRNLGVMDANVGIKFVNVDQSTISGDSVTKYFTGGVVLFNGSDTNTVTNSEATTNSATTPSGGFYLDGSSGNTFSNNRSNSNPQQGFYITGSTANTFSGNTANSNTQNGFNLVTGSNKNTFSNNTVQSNSGNGFSVSGSSNLTVSNNQVLSNGSNGLTLSSSSNNTFDSNTIHNNSLIGMTLASNSDTNIFRHNNVRHNNTWGVAVGFSFGNTFVQNTLDSNVKEQVYLEGSSASNTFVKNNIKPSTQNPDSSVLNKANTADMTRNWWSTADEDVITRRIADTAGLTFRPYRLGEVDTTPGADTTAPIRPTGITFDTTSVVGVVRVIWTAPTINEETNGGSVGFAGVKVYRLRNAVDTTHWVNALVWTAGASDTNWTDTGVATASTYYYRLTSRDAATRVNESNFTDTRISTVTAPGFTLSVPNGGQVWIVGETQTIAWTTTGSIANAKLEYSTNSGGTFSNIITSSTANTGSYAWNIPDAIGNTVRVRLSNAIDSSVSDTSDADFTIRGGFTVTQPNGGDSIQAGTAVNITWLSTGTISNVKLEYSTDSGSNWSTIAASTANTSSYSWSVPNTATTQAKVRVSHATDAATADTSNDVFQIWPVSVPPPPDKILLVSGNHQLGKVSTACTLPLTVQVVDTGGTAGVRYAKVTFIVLSTPTSGAALSNAGLPVYTDINGYVSDTVTLLGATAGVYRIEARADSITPSKSVYFTIYADGRQVSPGASTAGAGWTMIGPNKSAAGWNLKSASGGLGTNATVYEWRALSNDVSTLNNKKYCAPDAGADAVRGRAYWVKDPEGGRVFVPVDGNGTFDTVSVRLVAGWNQIASGQYFYMSWDSSVVFDTSSLNDTPLSQNQRLTPIQSAVDPDTGGPLTAVIQNKVYWYGGSGYTYGPASETPSLVTMQMKPMVGFWLYVLQSCTMYVYPNPASPADTNATEILSQAPLYSDDASHSSYPVLSATYKDLNKTGAEADWGLQLVASAGGVTDWQNYVGVKPTAARQQSMSAMEAPGLAAGYLTLAVRPSAKEAAASAAPSSDVWMAASYGAPTTTGRSWDVTVSSDLGNAATLTWDNVANLPTQFEAYLIGAPGSPIDLRKVTTVGVPTAGAPMILAIGLPEYVAPFLASPLSKEQSFVYPNPGPDDATGLLTFKYNMQATADVTIKIYDVGGKLVKELKTAGTAGSNTATWDTTNKNGQKVGSGVYIYILESSGNKLIDKLAIVR